MPPISNSGDEAPGQGLSDPEALVQLMERARTATGITSEHSAEPATGIP